MRCKGKCLCPPNLAGLTLPVSRLRLMNPPTVLKAKLYSSATSSRVKPASMSATTRSRRSSDYGFAIHHWPPCPSGNLESDSCLYGNHQRRFDFPGKCSSVRKMHVSRPVQGDESRLSVRALTNPPRPELMVAPCGA